MLGFSKLGNVVFGASFGLSRDGSLIESCGRFKCDRNG